MKLTDLDNELNPMLRQLATYPAIGWDIDGTLINSPASKTLQKFILDHPEIEHNIITARSGNLIDYIFLDLSEYPAKLTRKNFKLVVAASREKYYEYQKALRARQLGILTGPPIPIEIHHYTIKGRVCAKLHIPVLVDDDILKHRTGCKHYEIKLIDPMDCI